MNACSLLIRRRRASYVSDQITQSIGGDRPTCFELWTKDHQQQEREREREREKGECTALMERLLSPLLAMQMAGARVRRRVRCKCTN